MAIEVKNGGEGSSYPQTGDQEPTAHQPSEEPTDLDREPVDELALDTTEEAGEVGDVVADATQETGEDGAAETAEEQASERQAAQDFEKASDDDAAG